MVSSSSKPPIPWRVALLQDGVYRYSHEYRSSCNMRKNQAIDGLVTLVVDCYVIIGFLLLSCFYLIISPIFDLMSSALCFSIVLYFSLCCFIYYSSAYCLSLLWIILIPSKPLTISGKRPKIGGHWHDGKLINNF